MDVNDFRREQRDGDDGGDRNRGRGRPAGYSDEDDDSSGEEGGLSSGTPRRRRTQVSKWTRTEPPYVESLSNISGTASTSTQGRVGASFAVDEGRRVEWRPSVDHNNRGESGGQASAIFRHGLGRGRARGPTWWNVPIGEAPVPVRGVVHRESNNRYPDPMSKNYSQGASTSARTHHDHPVPSTSTKAKPLETRGGTGQAGAINREPIRRSHGTTSNNNNEVQNTTSNGANITNTPWRASQSSSEAQRYYERPPQPRQKTPRDEEREERPLIPHLNPVTAEVCYRSVNYCWNKGAHKLVALFESVYSDVDNPLSLALYFISKTPECDRNASRHAKNRVGFCEKALEALENVLLKRRLAKHKFLTRDLQMCTLDIIKHHRKLDIIQKVVELYNLADVKEEVENQLPKLSAQGFFREVIWSCVALQLYDFDDIHLFLVPLILEDRSNLVEVYLENERAKPLLQNLLVFFDSFTSDYDVKQWSTNYIKEKKLRVTCKDSPKMCLQAMHKLIKRLASKFEVEPTFFPNLTRSEMMSEMRYLFFRRYRDETTEIAAENFEDIIASLIKENTETTHDALRLLRQYEGEEFVVNFTRTYGIEYVSACSNFNVTSVEENWDDDDSGQNESSPAAIDSNPCDVQENVPMQNPVELVEVEVLASRFYSFPIPQSSINVVSTVADFSEFLQYLRTQKTNNAPEPTYAGIDCEWKPVKSAKCAALLQIAFRDRIFLIDLKELRELTNTTLSPFKRLVDEFFAAEDVVKIGYDFKNDFTMLVKCDQEWKNLRSQSNSILDVQKLHAAIRDNGNLDFYPFPADGNSTEKGLSELCRLTLGKPLTKREQFSDWERRPLRPAQVIYAATDAYCLLDIYFTMVDLDVKSPIQLAKLVRTLLSPPGEDAAKERT